MTDKREYWGLLRRRQCVLPTWRGWLVLVLFCLAVGIAGIRSLYGFLAPNDPLPGGVMVVEGFASDYALEAVVAEFHRHHYEKVYVTGGPLDIGTFLSEYRTFAERGLATLVKMGLTTNEVQAVPAPYERQDRTYSAAAALRDWWRKHGLVPTRVQLMSDGPHARRSRLLYRKALGKSIQVGVLAVEEKNYDPKHWWRSSAGFRNVVDESIAYLYAVLLFRPHGE